MDSESFLDLLAVPSFDDLCSAWGSPSDSDPCSMEGSAAFADYFDELINTEYRVNEEENDDDDEEEVELARSGFSKDSASLTRPPRSVLESVSSEKYSSVLKLSDIASALRNFSRTSEVSRPASRKLSSNRDFHVGSLSRPLSRPSDVNQNSDEHNLRCKDMGVESRPKKASDGSCGVRPHAIMVAGTQMSASNLLRCNSITVDETDQTRSNPCSIGRSMCDSSEDESSECSEEDDGPHSVLCEDTKPPIAHVKIIRRPNSNCGQRMSASPKRMKTVHLSAEATSSSEMVATADERDAADNLKQMRKDGMSQREVHILSERQRRKSMRESFSILQSLVPKLKLKHTDRITVLTEVITYIQSLRGALDELERKKADMMEFLGLSGKHRSRRQEDDLQATVTYIDPGNNLDDKVDNSGVWSVLKNGELVAMVEVTVRMCGPDVFLTLNAPQRRGVWSGVLSLLQKFSIEVSNATLASSGNSSFHCIHAKAMDVSTLKGVNLQEELERVIVKELGRQSKRHRN